MKSLILALATTTVLCAPALAAQIDTSSTVDAATVFPRGAEVTRLANLQIPAGDHEIIVADLPEDVDPSTVRVEGVAEGAVTIGAVDVRSELVDEGSSQAERDKIEEAIADLRQELKRLDREEQDLNVQRKLVQSLATGALAGGEKGSSVPATDLVTVLELTRTQLASLTATQSDIVDRRRATNKKIDALMRRLQDTQPRQFRRTVVTIAVNAAQDTNADFKIRYAANAVGWRATYDADLTLGDSAEESELQITRLAEVYQQTGESWDDVALTLSTARPRLASAPPDVSPWIVDVVKPVQLRMKQRGLNELQSMSSSGRAESFADAEVATAPQAIEMEAALPAMETGGFEATYKIAGRVDVANNGEVKSVTIDTIDLDTELFAQTAPSFDPTAYLMASFKVGEGATWLPGQVFLTRNGNHVGRGSIPLLAPGDDHRLGFGVDDLVTVEHREIDRQKGETGIISTNRTDETRFVTRIRNLHGFSMPIRVVNRVPVSNNENIEVRVLDTTTKPTSRDVDDKRGVYEWAFDMDSGTETSIDFGYRISWPADMDVSGVN